MRVLCVGGGSGGHVTPVLAVINELAKQSPELQVMFVSDRAFESQARGIMEHADIPVEVQVITAGKFRRYHNTSLVRQMMDLPTVAWNVRDGSRVLTGLTQSLRLLRKFKPDVVFAKGGYVCLPMGYAAKMLGVPVVIHDSDSRPGLTNSLLAKFAAKIATGAPLENYSYPTEKSVHTGVPIDARFHPYSASEQRAAKSAIGVVDLAKPLIVVTGGGLGAHSINTGIVMAAPQLVEKGVSIYHVTGKKHFHSVRSAAIDHPAYQIVEFVYKDMVDVLGAADVVISRGSATFIQELAALAKPTIIVPAHHLGDQNKNAAVYKAAGAAVVVTDQEVVKPTTLIPTIEHLLASSDERNEMVRRFHAFARPDAAEQVAGLILETYINSSQKLKHEKK